MEDWQPAITHYEDIINNPPSPDDSIFAIIDLGHTYFLMANSGGRSMATGNLLEHNPNSEEEFIEKRDYLLSLLPIIKVDNNNNNIESEQLDGDKLLQNIPNPFSEKTTIFFQLKEQGEGTIKVINTEGKVVRKISFNKPTGLHNVEFDMSELPIGVYFYTLMINGKRTDTKKMVVVR